MRPYLHKSDRILGIAFTALLVCLIARSLLLMAGAR